MKIRKSMGNLGIYEYLLIAMAISGLGLFASIGKMYANSGFDLLYGASVGFTAGTLISISSLLLYQRYKSPD